MSTSVTEERIRARAYEMWLFDGCPQGGDQLYWLRAKRDLFSKAPPAHGQNNGMTQDGPRLRGHIDVMTATAIAGWVQDWSRPNDHLDVLILDNGERLARLVASLFRADLKDANIGDGCFAYEYFFPEGFWSTPHHRISIVFPADPTWVCSNPVTAD